MLFCFLDVCYVSSQKPVVLQIILPCLKDFPVLGKSPFGVLAVFHTWCSPQQWRLFKTNTYRSWLASFSNHWSKAFIKMRLWKKPFNTWEIIQKIVSRVKRRLHDESHSVPRIASDKQSIKRLPTPKGLLQHCMYCREHLPQPIENQPCFCRPTINSKANCFFTEWRANVPIYRVRNLPTHTPIPLRT